MLSSAISYRVRRRRPAAATTTNIDRSRLVVFSSDGRV